MNKRIVAICCFAWIAILNARPASAQALIYTTVSATEVQVGPTVVESSMTLCDGNITNYLQRMKIGGHWRMVPVDFVVATGKYTLTLVGTCSDGSFVYNVNASPSSSLNVDYRSHVGQPERTIACSFGILAADDRRRSRGQQQGAPERT